MNEQKNIVVRFSGDSGDGMQLTGTLFSNLSAILGNEISTFPDFPAEIRAPQGTIGGVSSLQVCLGSSHVYTPGDKADVLVAMNPAALKVNKQNIHKDSIVIIDTDSFGAKDLEKALFVTDNPFTELEIPESVQIVPIDLTGLTKASLKDSGMDNKSILRSKNMFALGVICWLFNKPIERAIHFLETKFKKKPDLLQANAKVITDGYNYAGNLHLSINTFTVDKSEDLPHGMYTSIAGNKATAWGLIAAAEKAGKRLFLGSYPITPATDIMHELAARKDVGVMVVQAEDEIAGVCTAIGASFAGDLAVTSTSGPGLSLKGEAIGLAVMAELPLVVIDVQRGGPSTGLPTKTEQGDLLQALYGRNGECPAVVIAASTPANCFDFAYQAAKIAVENCTPVVLLTDTYLANGTSLWKLPKLAELDAITPSAAWKVAGTAGQEYRNMGLEHDAQTGYISTNPANHAVMVARRAKKVASVVVPDVVPFILGETPSETVLVGWGSTEGHLRAAGQQTGVDVVHFNYINPLPKNTHEVLSKYKRIIVCELNAGQFATYLRSQFPDLPIEQYNKTEAQPFTIGEIANLM